MPIDAEADPVSAPVDPALLGPPTEPINPARYDEISYAEFGQRFFLAAVTEDRINGAIAVMAGRGLQIGPLAIGGAGVHAEGKIGEPSVMKLPGESVEFSVTVPAGLLLHLKLVLSEVKLEAAVEIDLTMTARAAAPLSMVIDIPAITEDDVRIVFRAEALGAMWQWIIDPIADVIRREIASRINAMLSEPASVASRIFDIKSRIEETVSKPSLEFDWISYGDFGNQFIRHAVSLKRITEAVAELNGRAVQIGPMKTGPKDMAEVAATGNVEKPIVRAVKGELVQYDMIVPVKIDLTVALRRTNRYNSWIQIPIRLTAHTLDPLIVYVEALAPRPEQVQIDLKSQGMGAALLGMIGGIKRQIAEQVAATVAAETADTSSRLVDVAARINEDA